MFNRLFLLSFSVLIFAGCGNSDSPGNATKEASAPADKQLTTIQWMDSVRNFGKITEGQKLAVSFRFKNTGNKPLVIESVRPACGCTIADYPKQPLQPGEEGEVTGEFDSQGRVGQQHKEMTVISNTPGGPHNLVFEVNVIGKPSKGTN
jgi:hypothetical protein